MMLSVESLYFTRLVDLSFCVLPGNDSSIVFDVWTHSESNSRQWQNILDFLLRDVLSFASLYVSFYAMLVEIPRELSYIFYTSV